MDDWFDHLMGALIAIFCIGAAIVMFVFAYWTIRLVSTEVKEKEAKQTAATEFTTEEVTVSESYGYGAITDTADDGIEIKPYTDYEVYLIARTIAGEALITDSDTEMAAVAWCILNRVDSEKYPDTIEEVVTQPNQFDGYWRDKEYSEHIDWLVRDVLDRWYAEKDKVAEVGRVLPKEYVHFEGNGLHNYFVIEWKSTDYWDWSLPSPYDS